MGIADIPQTQGQSLLPAFDGKPVESPILLETMLPYYESGGADRPPTRLMGLRTPEWKMVYIAVEKEGGTYWTGKLYNVGKEPLELFDVRDDNKRTFNLMLNDMLAMTRIYAAECVSGDNTIEMDNETREKLKALGYLN